MMVLKVHLGRQNHRENAGGPCWDGTLNNQPPYAPYIVGIVAWLMALGCGSVDGIGTTFALKRVTFTIILQG